MGYWTPIARRRSLVRVGLMNLTLRDATEFPWLNPFPQVAPAPIRRLTAVGGAK